MNSETARPFELVDHLNHILQHLPARSLHCWNLAERAQSVT
jgi:hypothetical protein